MFNKCHLHWRKTLETEIMDRILHRNQWEKVYKLTESLKNVIRILGDANQSVWPRIYSLLSPIVTYCLIVDQISELLMHKLLLRLQNIDLGASGGF